VSTALPSGVLAAVVQRVWALPNELKKPDHDDARGPADFQKLFAEVEAKSGLTAKPKD
jgi:hypothetical protein